MCFIPITIEMDAIFIANAISNDNHFYPSDVYCLIEDCRLLLRALGRPIIKHVYREVNGEIDFVTKNADSSSNILFLFDAPPQRLGLYLFYDSLEMTMPRYIYILS